MIEELMLRSESFRGLCEDLAEAEAALALADRMPAEVRAVRRAEYGELVESLGKEIEWVLGVAKVASFATSKGNSN